MKETTEHTVPRSCIITEMKTIADLPSRSTDNFTEICLSFHKMPGPGTRRLQENPSFIPFQILFCSMYMWKESSTDCPTGSAQKPNQIRKNMMCVLGEKS